MSATTKYKFTLALLLIACDAAPSAEVCALLESVDAPFGSDSAALSANGLNFNGLSFNRLSLNRLSLNRISLNRLTLNRLTLNRLTLNRISLNELTENGAETIEPNATGPVEALAKTEDGRELLHYVARCALPADRALAVRVGEEVVVFPGNLGVAPEWETRALTEPEERWVSACLLAHVNAYGVSVPISVRAELIASDTIEEAAFPIHEGAFFGSVSEGAFYACSGDEPELARSASSDRNLRVCTDPSPDCEIAALGACSSICARYEAGTGWTGCVAGGKLYDEVINVHLREDALMAACLE